MYKIINAELKAKDEITHNCVKSIITTKGEFDSRQSAYTQTIEEIERTIKNYMNIKLNGPPISTIATYYPTNPPLSSNWIGIKEITNSRLERNEYDDILYNLQVKRFKTISSSSERVVIYFLSLSMNEWTEISEEDLISFSLAQAEAGVPHVSSHMSPYQTAKDYLNMIKNKIIPELKNKQTLNPILHPVTIRKESKEVIEKIAQNMDYPIISSLGRTPNPVKHSIFYSNFFRKIPTSKITLCLDVGPKQDTGLALEVALRQFNMDITSRSVWFPRGRQSYQLIQRTPDQLLMYNDHVAGMLNNEDIIKWESVSIKDILMDNFPAKTGLNYEDLIKAYNFIAINKTGITEVEKILEGNHKEYIENRLYLETLWRTKAKYLAIT